MDYIVRSSEDYGYAQSKPCSIVRELGVRKYERSGKTGVLVFHIRPTGLKYPAEHTTTVIQSVFVPAV